MSRQRKSGTLYADKKEKYEDLSLFYGVFIKENKVALVSAQGNMYKNMLELPNVDPIEEHLWVVLNTLIQSID